MTRISPESDLFFLTGFIITFASLNLVAYLIASFYRKKFDPTAPRAGFLVAFIIIILYNASLFFSFDGNAAATVIKVLMLFGGSIASASTAASLYYTMKKVRK
jgi:hypothetical protein